LLSADREIKNNHIYEWSSGGRDPVDKHRAHRGAVLWGPSPVRVSSQSFPRCRCGWIFAMAVIQRYASYVSPVVKRLISNLARCDRW